MKALAFRPGEEVTCNVKAFVGLEKRGELK